MQSIFDQITQWLKDMLISGIMGNLSGMFDSVNQQVGQIAGEVGMTPASFSPGVFSLIRNISESVILPIAGIVLTFIACWELIQMIIDHNNLANFETWIFFKWVFKTFVAVLLISNTFNITMAVFDVAQHVISQSGSLISGSTAVDAEALSAMQETLESMSLGELCGLQMKDISLTDKTISINKTVQRIYDKKKGTSYVHIGPPKTKTSARTIPVPSLLMNIIKKFYTDNPNHYFLTGKTKPTEPRTYRQFFTRFLKRNGLEKVKFHEIRHTFAVRAIEIPEFDIKSLSEILGHKNVSFTLNVYGSANLQQKVKCMNLLNELL